MVEHITRMAQRLLRRAHAEAERFTLAPLGADALFLGLLRERACVAAGQLKAHGLDLTRARSELESVIRSTEYRQRRQSEPQGSTAWKQLYADVIARKLTCINTVHILLGILHDDASAAVGVLARHGLAPECLRAEASGKTEQPADLEGGAVSFHEKKSPAEWLQALQDTNARVRTNAAMTLGAALTLDQVTLQASEAVPVLTGLLNDTEKLVRLSAANLLRRFGAAARSAAPALRQALQDRHEVRLPAIETLASIGAEVAGDDPLLAQVLRDPSLAVRAAAAEVLWNSTRQLGRVLPVLVEALSAADHEVCCRAVGVLARIGPAAETAVPALAVKAVVPALAALLEDKSETSRIMGVPLTRLGALHALRAIGPDARAAVPAIVAVLREGNFLLSASAKQTLAAIAPTSRELLLALLPLLHDPSPRVCGAAVQALGQLGPAGVDSVPLLREALANPDGSVRVQAALWLVQLGHTEGVLPVLLAALDGAENNAAVMAAGVLGKLGSGGDTVPALRVALESRNPYLRAAAAGALWRLEHRTDTVLPALIAILRDPDENARLLSIHQLGEMGPAAREAIPELVVAGSSLSRIFAVSVQRTLSRIDPTASLEADTPLVVPGPDAVAEEQRPSQRALTMWSEAIELDPEDGQAYRCRARAHRELGDLRRAVADATEAVRIDPDDAEAYLIRGQAHLDAKDLDRAIADFGETLRREPNRLSAYNQRAIASKLRGDIDQAIADYTELLRLKPDSHQAYLNRSLAWKKKQAYDRVVADLQEALRLDPEYAVAHNNLACLQATCLDAAFRDGNSALAHAHKACQLSGWGRPIMLNTLAAAHAEVGQFDEAVRWQKKALAHPEKLTPVQVEEFTTRLRRYEQQQPAREG